METQSIENTAKDVMDKILQQLTEKGHDVETRPQALVPNYPETVEINGKTVPNIEIPEIVRINGTRITVKIQPNFKGKLKIIVSDDTYVDKKYPEPKRGFDIQQTVQQIEEALETVVRLREAELRKLHETQRVEAEATNIQTIAADHGFDPYYGMCITTHPQTRNGQGEAYSHPMVGLQMTVTEAEAVFALLKQMRS